MLTVKQAAECLGVSSALIYALCAHGKIAHQRFGLGRGTIRIPEEALQQYQETARVEHERSTPAGLKHIRMWDAASP